MFGIFVGVGVDRDCGDAELFCGFYDAACDLAAVGDQDLLEHFCWRFFLRGNCELEGG